MRFVYLEVGVAVTTSTTPDRGVSQAARPLARYGIRNPGGNPLKFKCAKGLSMETDDAQQTRSETSPDPARPAPKKRDYSKAAALSRMAQHGLLVGSLPKGMASITRAVNHLKLLLEAQAVSQLKVVGPVELMVVQTALRWERHGLVCQRALRHLTLSPDQYLAFSREVARASSERDKALRSLGLKASLPDPDHGLPDFDDEGSPCE